MTKVIKINIVRNKTRCFYIFFPLMQKIENKIINRAKSQNTKVTRNWKNEEIRKQIYGTTTMLCNWSLCSMNFSKKQDSRDLSPRPSSDLLDSLCPNCSEHLPASQLSILAEHISRASQLSQASQTSISAEHLSRGSQPSISTEHLSRAPQQWSKIRSKAQQFSEIPENFKV